jgi:ubiquinone/menaquinone biosynthesis C-methylase UbiE
MAEPQQIRFEDGAAYERFMGVWSRKAGDVFIDWLKPAPGLKWLDVGCGNGAFTELLIERTAPASVDGIDPSDGQLDFARKRPAGKVAKFHKGDAMALPFEAASFDAAVMALVIFFVPEPAKGVAEMVRVVKPGGLISAYAWDVPGGGLPFSPIVKEMRSMGLNPPQPPSSDVSRMEALQEQWTRAGLVDVETREITVSRTFPSFDEFWTISASGPSLKQLADTLPPAELVNLKGRIMARLPAADVTGQITYSSRANAIKGRVPK